MHPPSVIVQTVGSLVLVAMLYDHVYSGVWKSSW